MKQWIPAAWSCSRDFLLIFTASVMSSWPSEASGRICHADSHFIKRGMEKRSCYRKRIRCLFHSSFFCPTLPSWAQLCRLERGGKTCCFSLSLPEKRNGKTLMLTKTHSLPFPFLFSLVIVVTPSGAEGSALSAVPTAIMSPRASVERSVDSGRFPDSGPPDLRSEWHDWARTEWQVYFWRQDHPTA